ncbi:MAG: TIGR00266 family protein [Victivallales bacterium]|nr:TIGR00266 family protein [Victivallales bacterium]
MQYNVEGGDLPVLKILLEAGEQIQCEAGAMSWMDEGIEMQTTAGGLGKMLGRMFTNESAFMNTYVANQSGEIAFSSKFPGSIRAVEITPGNGLIIQKGSYLASAGNLRNEVYLRQRLSTGFFGGEGFLLRKFTGTGIVFLEIDGSAHEYELPAGSCKIIDTGYLAAMTESCSMEIRSVKGIKNMLFGGEGFFNTAVKGPGRIIIQSMPISSTATVLYHFMPHGSH